MQAMAIWHLKPEGKVLPQGSHIARYKNYWRKISPPPTPTKVDVTVHAGSQAIISPHFAASSPNTSVAFYQVKVLNSAKVVDVPSLTPGETRNIKNSFGQIYINNRLASQTWDLKSNPQGQLVLDRLPPLSELRFAVRTANADGFSPWVMSEPTITTWDGVVTLPVLPIPTPAPAPAPSPTPSPSPSPTPTPTPTYSVGTAGPSGGKVFYYNAGGFNCGPTFSATGSPTGGLCHYLEAAPTTGSTPWTDAVYVFSNVSNAFVPNGTSTALGAGYQNSLNIISQDASMNAAKAARAYQGGGNSDWYLPSKDELFQIFLNNAAEFLNVSNPWYQSSSESTATLVWSERSDNQNVRGNAKSGAQEVRPIRAF